MHDEVTPEGRQAMQSALAAVTASMASEGASLRQTSVPQVMREIASLVAVVRLLVAELSRESGKDEAAIWEAFCSVSAASLEGPDA